ncbi:metallophosphoesterase family protein [Acinetobacter sp.]|uniref:metallophosphoesterase family protein n=1 Tax=Acinetobacter sp. TaxID=472 RepID=UPI003D045987
MSRIFITGDTHRNIDIEKLSERNWPEQKELTKDDYLIIAGDFGMIWDPEPTEQERDDLKELSDRSFTTLFVDGNHENHARLNEMPQIEKFGGTVGWIAPSIMHLKRGQVYTINGMKFFTMGGAESIDKYRRIRDISWWPGELPTTAEMLNAMLNLDNHNWEVEYVITHTAPLHVIKAMDMHDSKIKDPMAVFLEEMKLKLKFKEWFFGHMHQEWDSADSKFHGLYNRILEI